jgi:Family of unknown function (DUF5677)
MPTEPAKSILDREGAIARAHESIDQSCLLLREIVNFATVAFTQIAESPVYQGSAENEETAQLILYLHMIEMADGTEVLLSQSCVAPAEPLVRSLFEAYLSIMYILADQAHLAQRSLAWQVGYVHDQIRALERLDPNTTSGATFKQTFANSQYGPLTPGGSLPDIQSSLDDYRGLLAQPQFAPIEAEWQRLSQKNISQKNKRIPKWYSLFGGPADLRMLARRLDHEPDYDLLYGNMSTTVHPEDMSRFVMLPDDGPGGWVRPLRDPAHMKVLVVTTTGYMLSVLRPLYLRYFPNPALLDAWYQKEVMPRFMSISSD